MGKTNDRKRTTLRIPKEIDNKIIEVSKKMGISKNAYITMSISKMLKNYSERLDEIS